MKATKQYFSVGLLIMLYKVVLTFESVDILKKQTDFWKCSFMLLSLISPPNPTIFNW